MDRFHIAFVVWVAITAPTVVRVSERTVLAQADGGEDGAAVLERIRADWQRRLFAMDRVRYIAVGTRTVVRGALNGNFDVGLAGSELPPNAPENLPVADTTLDTTQGVLLDFQNDWARRESIHHMFSPATLEFLPFHDVYVYDGVHFRHHRPNIAARREEYRSQKLYPIELYIGDPAKMQFFFEAEQYPFFLNHGLVPFRFGIRPDRLRPAAIEMEFAFRGVARDADRNVVVLRSSASPRAADSFSELWVDVERQSAITRWTYMSGGREKTRYEMTYALRANDWLLDGWRMLRFEEDRLVGSIDMRVTTLEVNPAVAVTDFQIEPSVGMVVSDPSESGRYVQGATPGERVLVADLFAKETAVRETATWLYATVVLVALVCALLAARFVRRARLRRHPG